MNLNLNFSEPKSINVDNVKKISVKTNDGKPVRIITKKCDSFGVKRSEKYDSKSISIILDEDSVDDIWKIILKIEENLKKPLSKILYERDDGNGGHTTTIYPKIRDISENESEIDPMVYEKKKLRSESRFGDRRNTFERGR